MAGIQETLAKSGVDLPSINVSWLSGNFILYFLFGILGVMLVAGICFYFYWNLLFNKRIILFRNLGNIVIPSDKDRGKFERIGLAGDYWMRTRKFKKFLPRPKLQMGKNVYWFYEREDGEWINFTLKNIDELMKKANVHYIDEDMRLQRLGIQRNLNERYNKLSWWHKYGTALMGVVFMLIVTICLVVLFDKMNELPASFVQAAKSIEVMANALRDVAGNPSLIPINSS